MKINRGIVSQKSKERIAMKSKKQTLLAVSSMMGFIVLWATVTDAWNYSAFLFPVIRPSIGSCTVISAGFSGCSLRLF